MRQAKMHNSPTQRPARGTRTGRVWEIADQISREKGRRAERNEVIEKFVAEDGNLNTASTQYHQWKQQYEHQAQASSLTRLEPGSVDFVSLSISPDGRLQIPARMRDAMLLDSEGRVTARVVDGELRIISPVAAIRKVQRIARAYKKPGESVVDEFLAERKAMWGEE